MESREPLHIILIALGSAGDVHPPVGIGRALLARGHRVTLATNPYFEKLVRGVGLEFSPLDTGEDFEKEIRNPDLWHPTKSFRVVARKLMLPYMPLVYSLIEQRHVPGRTVVAAPGTAFGARIAREKPGVPLATFHLQPSLLRSLHETPVMGIPDVITPLPRPLKAMMFWLIDRLVIDKELAPGVNAYRAQLGLPPVRRLFKDWLHSPDLVINLFPEWYSPPQPDWPPNTRHTGFPLFDEAGVREIPAAVAEFLDAGEPPIVFTAGSAMALAGRFLTDSAEICRRLDRRGILLTQFPDQVPPGLPPTVKHFDYIPFSQVLPRAAAFVHHGGIGTTAQAFAAGLPQLVTPFAHDQPDNAHRVKQLGAGDFVLPRQYAAKGLEAIKRLIEAPEIKRRCQELAGRLRGADPLRKTCELIESIAGKA